MTSQIPSTHGIHDRIRIGNMPAAADKYLDELSCYIDVLDDNGYINSLCGKCHLGIAWTHDMVFHTGLLYRLVVGSRYNNAEMIQNG